MPADVMPHADELCEVLRRPIGVPPERLLPTEPALLVGVIEELGRRGALPQLLAAATGPLIERAHAAGALGALFQALTRGGHYEQLRAALRRASDALADLLPQLAAARPSFGEAELNAAALAFAKDTVPEDSDHDALIVPGYTPPGARGPLGVRDLPPAQQRLERAAELFQQGAAPLVLLTGGCVYPPGTPHNEALHMREYLIERGVPAAQILVEPYARHTTTNLRNAGRILLDLDRPRGLIVTGFESPLFHQGFYLSRPTISTFHDRCRRELGYLVGELDGLDEHLIRFVPSPEVYRRTFEDPWDA